MAGPDTGAQRPPGAERGSHRPDPTVKATTDAFRSLLSCRRLFTLDPNYSPAPGRDGFKSFWHLENVPEPRLQSWHPPAVRVVVETLICTPRPLRELAGRARRLGAWCTDRAVPPGKVPVSPAWVSPSVPAAARRAEPSPAPSTPRGGLTARGTRARETGYLTVRGSQFHGSTVTRGENVQLVAIRKHPLWSELTLQKPELARAE